MFVAGEAKGNPPVFARGDVAELAVYDDHGHGQGHILVGVLDLGQEYKKGMMIQGMFLVAQDLYYLWWMNNGADSPDRDNAMYHLCAVHRKKCPPTSKFPRMIHSDKYRNWGVTELTSKEVPWLKDKDLKKAFDSCFAKFRGVVDAKGLPSRTKPRTKETLPSWVDEEAEEDDVEEADPETSGDEATEDEGVKKRIIALREELKAAEEEAAGKKESRRKRMTAMKKEDHRGRTREKEKARSRSPKKAKEKTVAKTEKASSSKVKKKKKGKRSESGGSRDSKGRRKGVKSDPPAKVVKKKKKKKDSSDPGDPEDDSSSDDEESQDELFASKKPEAETKKVKDKDRGPFGGGAPIGYGAEESSSDEETVFQKGLTTTAKGSQQKLLQYTNRHPGRLASRLLLRMQEATARGVVGPSSGSSEMTPPVALNHVLTILIPSLGPKVGVRTSRELKTLGAILDHLSGGHTGKAADIVGQRMKALERATHEGHWGAAQFLELLPPENTMLLEKDEELFVTNEYLKEQKLKSYDRGSQRKDQEPKGRGKGDRGKGKDKNQAKGDKGTWDKNAPKKDEASK